MKTRRNTFLLFLQCFHLTEAQPGPRWEYKVPDFSKCHVAYGTGLSMDSCRRALSQIPTHGDPELQMTFFQYPHNQQIERDYQLPVRFSDPAPNGHTCAIDIQLEPTPPSHSIDAFAFTATQLRQMVEEILRDCVSRRGVGGFITSGLCSTTEYLFEPDYRQGTPVSTAF